jgi:hypothetical protein
VSHGVLDPKLVKEVVENYPIRIEGGTGVHSFRLSPGEELLYVLGRDKPGVGFGCYVLNEEFEDVFIFLMGEGFAARFDVFKEHFDGFLKRQRLVFCLETREFEAAFFRAQLKAFAFLCFEAACRSRAIR